MTNLRELSSFFNGRRLVVLAGAGISMVPPSSLPSWWGINTAVLGALARRVAAFTGKRFIEEEVPRALGERRDKTAYFPPDYQAQLLEDEIGEDYFRVLQALDAPVSNRVHRSIAALGRAGRLAALVTTNFDRLIERALDEFGVAHVVDFTPSHFGTLDSALGSAGERLHLVKVHGSVEDPSSMVDTMRQRLMGRPEALELALRSLFSAHPVVFIGFSGADLDYDPHYLQIRAGLAESPGYVFLVRQGEKPKPVVANLAADFPSKVHIVSGELPAWMDELLASLGVAPPNDGLVPAPTLRDPAAELRAHLDNWSNSLGDISALNCLTSLLTAVGEEALAFRLLRRTWEFYRSPTDSTGRAYARYNHNYGRMLLNAGLISNSMSFEEDPAAWKRAADQNAVEFLLRSADVSGASEPLFDACVAWAWRGEVTRAVDAVEQLWDTQDGRHGWRPIVDGAVARAIVLELAGKFTPALTGLETAYAMAQRFGDEPRRARVAAYLARLVAYKGRFDDARHVLKDGGMIAARLDLRDTAAWLRLAEGVLLLQEGDHVRARDALLDPLKEFAARESRPALICTLLEMARAAWLAGDEALRDQSFDQLENLVLNHVVGYRPHYYLLHAQLSHHFGRGDEARLCLDAAEQNGATQGNGWALMMVQRLREEFFGPSGSR